ncbi:MAG: phosphotransferase family protein, partial [Anaerolineales bacterium]
MKEQEPYWHAAIHQIMPDLEIRSLVINHEGLVNDILIVNKTWVFRFTNGEYGRELLNLEYELMRLIGPMVSLSVPTPSIYNNEVIVYPYLNGETFYRNTWSHLEEEKQQKLADQLGKFLNELHSIPTKNLEWEIPMTLAPISFETWGDIYERLMLKVYPLLLPHQINWAEELFQPVMNQAHYFDFDPVIIHGDLAPYHILYSSEKASLSSVIDFGLAGLGDPATDLGALIHYYGERLVSKMADTYDSYAKLISRARFYAQAIELQWALMAIESGDDYWFTAHLGGARDIG